MPHSVMKHACSILFPFLIGAVHAGDLPDSEVRPGAQTSWKYGDYTQSQPKRLRTRYENYLQIKPNKYRGAHHALHLPNPTHHIDRFAASTQASAHLGANATQTATHLATLDQELQTSMGRFDEMILQEQARVKAAAPARRESADFFGDGDGDGAASTPLESGRRNGSGHAPADKADGAPKASGQDRRNRPPGSAPHWSHGPNNGQGNGDPGRNSGERTGREGNPKDREDAAADDDIVARQLREAAEQETDPELRARLWEEYRHYKQGR